MARNFVHSDPFGNLTRFDPLGIDPFRSVDEVMREFSLLPSLRGVEAEPRIRMDVEETDQHYLVKADMPGMKKEDIKVAIEGKTVSIQAQSLSEKQEQEGGNVVRRERYVGQHYRCFALPQEIDENGAEARYENGVLALTLPKKSGAVSKTLSIK